MSAFVFKAIAGTWDAWGGAPLAFAGVLVFTPLVIRLAHRMDWLAYPKRNRWHSSPTALMGGMAIYAAATLGLVFSASSQVPLLVWGGATLMFGTGLVDDLWGVRPVAKLVAQVVATGLLLGAGYAFGAGWPFWITIPLTFLWVIGVTNALNLLDNMDGLAAGIAAITAGVLAIFSGLEGSLESMGLALVVTGAAGGFLIFNFKPARIFMGDSGSLFLGYIIAALALLIQGEVTTNRLAAYLVPLAALAVPIFDTTLVTMVRTLSGRAVSQGGRDHTSHRLVFLGLSEQHAVLVLYGLSLLSGGLALVFLFVDVKLFYALTIFVGLGMAVLGIYLGRANVYHEDDRHLAPTVDKAPLASRWGRVLHAFLGPRWKAAFGVIADLLLIIAAFIAAHYLRFETGFTTTREMLLVQSLPIVIVLKIAVFYSMGLYQSIWRHAGTPELVRVVKATILASGIVFAALEVLYSSGRISQAALFIDWMITTIAIVGVRFSFRGLRQYLASKREGGKRVLLYGAGDAGLLALREIRQNAELELTPIGFIDDDPLKHGQVVQGLRVLGEGNELSELCQEHDVEEVLITILRISEMRMRAICNHCREIGVECRTFRSGFEVPHLEPQRASTAEVEYVNGHST